MEETTLSLFNYKEGCFVISKRYSRNKIKRDSEQCGVNSKNLAVDKCDMKIQKG